MVVEYLVQAPNKIPIKHIAKNRDSIDNKTKRNNDDTMFAE
jgi:hypothetical protein